MLSKVEFAEAVYIPSSKRHLARTIISGRVLFVVCLVVRTLEPHQASRPVTARQDAQGIQKTPLPVWGLCRHH